MQWLPVQGRKLLLAAVSIQHLEERGVLSGAVLWMKHYFVFGLRVYSSKRVNPVFSPACAGLVQEMLY